MRGVSAKEIETLLPQFMAWGDKENTAAAAEVHQVMIKQIGVCSFAGDPRSILMWTHYASNQTGICLVFELARDPKIFVQAFKVSYTDEYPIVNWYTDRAHFGHKIALRKHPMWRYEDERRIVLVDRANTRLKFRPDAIRAIILGCRAGDSTLNLLQGLLRERSTAELPAVDLYRCEMHEGEYKLRIRSIKS